MAGAAGQAAPAILARLFRLMMGNVDDLALTMAAEPGKLLAESRGEAAYAAGCIKWFAEEAKRVYGDIVPPAATRRRMLVTKEPIRVFAAIWTETAPFGDSGGLSREGGKFAIEDHLETRCIALGGLGA